MERCVANGGQQFFDAAVARRDKALEQKGMQAAWRGQVEIAYLLGRWGSETINNVDWFRTGTRAVD